MRVFLSLLLVLFSARNLIAAESVTQKDYSAVHALFEKYCLDCHGPDDPEGNLVLEDFESLMKGGESGASIVPGKSGDSLLVKMLAGEIEKEGKKIVMPPGKKRKLDAVEVAAIKAWIDAGAHAPAESSALVKELVVPKIIPKNEPRNAINALAYSSQAKLIAVARYGEVDLISADTHSLVRTLSGHRGNVNAVIFSANGSELFAVSGESALYGEVKQWNVADGKLLRAFEGHRDTIYCAALSSDQKVLATGSYDQKIKLWDVASGKELKTLSGHNGAVFGLSFRPAGKILASASADSTVKLWDIEKGERLDTLTQSSKDVHAVAFSPDGKKLYAGGVDNRIRVWRISETVAETSNPILESRFAHEGAILRLAFSPDGKLLLSSANDRMVKLWDAVALKEIFVLETQPDWCAAITFGPGKEIVVGRMDGSIAFYNSANGKLISQAGTTALITKPEHASK